MALIVCPECARQISDRATVCPHCGFPISKEDMPVRTAKPAKTRRIFVIVGLIAVLAAGVMAGKWYLTNSDPEAALEKAYLEASQRYNSGDYKGAMSRLESLGDYKNTAELMLSCKYNLGYEAMKDSKWRIAASYFKDLNYESSENLLVDCRFMMALEESVLYRMEIISKESWDERSLISTELAYLEEFRTAAFYDVVLGMYAGSYIDGLEDQLESLNYGRNSNAQMNWYAGTVTKMQVLDMLYRNFGFMEDNKDFVGTYINQLGYYEKWLDAMNSMEVNGHKRVKDPEGNELYVEYYLKNDTMYTSTQTFTVTFWKDEEGKQMLGNSSVTVENIKPYKEYTVRVPLPATVREMPYYFNWSNYYEEILVN